MLKKLLLLCFIPILVIGGCKNVGNEGEGNTESIVLRLAEYFPADYPNTLADYEFARLVYERTDGRIDIRVFEGGQLGTEKSVTEQVQFGAIDFARISIAPVAEVSPQLNVLQLPYIYRDEEHMWKVLDSEIGDYFLESIEEQGFIGLCYYDAGARSFYNSVREIKSIEDLKGLNFRVMESQLMADIAIAFGATVTPMPFENVYQSIQKGEIDGAENNFPSYETTLHYEVAPYYTIDEHARVPEILLASGKIMDRIDEADLAIIKECAKETESFQREKWAERVEESERIVREGGSVITQLEDTTEFKNAVKSLYIKYAANYMDIVKEIQNME